MPKFIISGGKKLNGEIKISGSKNAVLALIPATLLADSSSTLTNVPSIKDVDTMAEILRKLGASVDYDKQAKKITIDPTGVNRFDLDQQLSSKLRASILFIGPMLAKFKKVVVPSSGGDRIGVRTIDPHLISLKQLGAEISIDKGYEFFTKGLTGATVVLEESSVTATENLLMAASLATGTTIIKLAAMEPHVQQVAEFLNKMGAKISGIGTPTYVIEGVPILHGAEIAVVPDSNQAATYITMAAATKGHVKISQINPEFLDDFLLKIRLFGVNFKVGKDFVEVFEPEKPYRGIKKMQVGLYPKLPSDDIPPMSVLATQAEGETMIYEWLYENRLGYAPELNRMGAKTEVLDPHRVKIIGPTKLHGEKLVSTDIRMGMALVIAALVAEGQSEVENVGHIDRGYEDLEANLKSLGADIQRVEDKELETVNQVIGDRL